MLNLGNQYIVAVQPLSRVQLLQPHGLQPARLLCPWNSPGKNTGVDCHFLLQGIFPTQELNQGLLNCRQILFQLRYEGSPVHSFEEINTQGLIISFFLLCLCLEISKTKNLRKKFNIYAIFGECCYSKKRDIGYQTVNYFLYFTCFRFFFFFLKGFCEIVHFKMNIKSSMYLSIISFQQFLGVSYILLIIAMRVNNSP